MSSLLHKELLRTLREQSKAIPVCPPESAQEVVYLVLIKDGVVQSRLGRLGTFLRGKGAPELPAPGVHPFPLQL